jgi:hypothetical protein
MSYIRSTNNPEGLYIICSGKYVEISEGSKKSWNIPVTQFRNILKKWKKRGWVDEDVKYKDTRVREIFIPDKKQDKNWKKFIKTLGPIGKFKIRLSYKRNHIDMWFVTWDYIINNNSFRLKGN